MVGVGISSDGNVIVTPNGGSEWDKIDVSTGAATPIGPIGFSDVNGLSFHPVTGVLYGVGWASP